MLENGFDRTNLNQRFWVSDWKRLYKSIENIEYLILLRHD